MALASMESFIEESRGKNGLEAAKGQQVRQRFCLAILRVWGV